MRPESGPSTGSDRLEEGLQRRANTVGPRHLFSLGALWGVSVLSLPAHGQQAPRAHDQSVLGPGAYVFQTRTLSAACGDDERTGYVSSFIALIDGIPGSATMSMRLLGSRYWSSWTLTVSAEGQIRGEAFMDGTTGNNRPVNRIQLRLDGERFTGQGTRIYDRTVSGRRTRCAVTVEALLRRIDI